MGLFSGDVCMKYLCIFIKQGSACMMSSAAIKKSQETLASMHSLRAKGERHHFPDEMVESILAFFATQNLEESRRIWPFVYNT